MLKEHPTVQVENIWIFSCTPPQPYATIGKIRFSKVSYIGTSDSGISENVTFLRMGLCVLPFRKFVL